MDKLQKEYFAICDRLTINKNAQKVRYVGTSKALAEQIAKDEARRKELAPILGIELKEESRMAIKLLCPECGSDNVVAHFTSHQKTEKFKCKDCKKVRLITKMSYATIEGDNEPLKSKVYNAELY